ncbi:type II toxin-antitoxin system YoeB family toxin [Streptomyces sp. NPDC048428]|uniref:type II toxin-antitoxin system YoeB family toxin n=1 Tax=Streptomyces sp. NPDC048428 TaxID=3154503 RepID=UPI00343D8B43
MGAAGTRASANRSTLRHDFHGYCSRRISDGHRLIHRVVEDEARIASCRCHYGR